MTADEAPFDYKVALDASTALITEARADLIKTIETYDADAPGLAETTLERLASLNPEASPARQDAAAGLREELPRFGDFWVPLASNGGLLLFALVQNLTNLAMQMMSPQFPSPADLEGLDPISAARAHTNAVHEAVKRNEIIMACAVVSETEVAEAVQEAAELLTARLNLLTAFIHCTEPAPPDPSATPNWFKIGGKIVGNETALRTAEQFLTAVITELPRQVPVVGIAFSVISICQHVREKQKTLRERRELMASKAAAYLGLNATDDMSIQLTHLQQDNKTIKELLALIEDLTGALGR